MLLYVHRDCKDYWGRAIKRAAMQAITDIHPFSFFFFFHAHIHSLYGSCDVRPWLSEFSGVVLSRFTLSRSTIFTDVSLIKSGRLIEPIVAGHFFLHVSVMAGLGNCEYIVTVSSRLPVKGEIHSQWTMCSCTDVARP